MGFLDRIFGTPQIKEYSLDEAMELIEKELQEAEQKNLEESYQSAMKVHRETNQLASLIDEFGKKENPETAKPSERVKERFCKLSLHQLSTLADLDPKNSSNYIKSVKNIINTLGGLTQRQMLHINFFFKDDFKQIARKISEINSLLEVKQKSSDQAKAVAFYQRIRKLEESKSALQNTLLSNEEKLKKLENKRHDLPPVEKQPDIYDLAGAENRLRSIKQEIDSFLAVQKLLKKYVYVERIKDTLLEMYIESPSSALLKDSEMKIIGHVEKASQLVKAGKIDTDLPEKKIDSIREGRQFLLTKRNELENATKLTEKEKERLDHLQVRFEASLKIRTNQLSYLEGEIRNLNKIIENAKQEEASINTELARLKPELYLSASKILNANIKPE